MGKIFALIRAIRLRRQEISFEEDQNSPGFKLIKHRKNLERCTRMIQGIYATLLVSVAENLPLGLIQLIYSLRLDKLDSTAKISLVTSWWSLGAGLGKVITLKDALPYRAKQTRKVKELLK